jgi:hypothetical protein
MGHRMSELTEFPLQPSHTLLLLPVSEQLQAANTWSS